MPSLHRRVGTLTHCARSGPSMKLGQLWQKRPELCHDLGNDFWRRCALKKKRPVGRPKFEPTPEQRNIVERAAGFGFTQEKIAALIGITKPTLEKHFREELDRGMAVTQFKVGNSLVENALAGNVAAQIWYTKSRMGWKETQVVETKTAVDSMSADDLAKAIEEKANALGVKVTLSIE